MKKSRKHTNISCNTRYGPPPSSSVHFGDEIRFKWQLNKSKAGEDAMYDIPTTLSQNGGIMGSSTRLDRSKSSNNPPPIVNPSTGPGTYDVDRSYKLSSKQGYSQRFNMAPRKGLASSSDSPGPIYELRQSYKYGVDKRLGISFNSDKRRVCIYISCCYCLHHFHHHHLYLLFASFGKSVSLFH